MSGGVDSSVAAALMKAGRPRGHRGHPQDVARPFGRSSYRGLLHRQRLRGRPPGRRPTRHSVLRARLHGSLPERCDRSVRCRLPARPHSQPLRRVQSDGQVLDTARAERRFWLRSPRHRPLCPRQNGGGAAATAARQGSRTRTSPTCSPCSVSAELGRVRFPVGNWKRRETRELAVELGLRTAAKPDSQDICFVGKDHYRNFLRRVEPATVAPGPIVDTSGQTWDPIRASPVSRSASGGDWASPSASAGTWSRCDRRLQRSSWEIDPNWRSVRSA